MTVPDVSQLQAAIVEIKAELSRARVEAEVVRALYERQAIEIDDLLAPRPGDQQPASRKRHLCFVGGNDPAGLRGSGPTAVV